MLDLLQETLFYIEEQNAWLSYLQSAIVEKEQKYRILHSKIKDEIKKEWEQQQQIVMIGHRGNQNDIDIKEEQGSMNAESNYWQQEDNTNSFHENNEERSKITASTVTECTQNIDDSRGMSLYHSEEFVKIPEISESFNAVKNRNSSSLDSVMKSLSSNSNHNSSNGNVNSNLEVTPVAYHSQFPTSQKTKDSEVVTKAIENISPSAGPVGLETPAGPVGLKTPAGPVGLEIPAGPVGLEIIVSGNNEVVKKDGFNCPQCNKVWPNKQSLKQHFQTHTGEKPFNCSFCNKAFGRQGTLNRHMLIHTGEKPFKCFICNKSFRHKFNLNVHQNRHTGEKPYKCTYCGKSFGQRSTLSYHWKTHRGTTDKSIEWSSTNEAENNKQVSPLSTF